MTPHDEPTRDVEVRDVPEADRFEARVDDALATLDYVQEGDTLRLVHTEVPEALAGRGVGSRLVRGALDAARERGLRIAPECGFVAAYLRRHPEVQDLVAPGHREALGI